MAHVFSNQSLADEFLLMSKETWNDEGRGWWIRNRMWEVTHRADMADWVEKHVKMEELWSGPVETPGAAWY